MKKLLKCSLMAMALFGILIPDSAMAWVGWGAGNGYHGRWHHVWHHRGIYTNCPVEKVCLKRHGRIVNCKLMKVCYKDHRYVY